MLFRSNVVSAGSIFASSAANVFVALSDIATTQPESARTYLIDSSLGSLPVSTQLDAGECTNHSSSLNKIYANRADIGHGMLPA